MRIVILGNGVSGITAARFIRKLSDHEIFVISNESDYFFSRTALMYVYMGHMRWKDIQPYENSFWSKNRITLVKDLITGIDFNEKRLTGQSGQSFDYDHLILALGSKTNKFGWPGQDLNGVAGLYSKQDLELMETYSPDLNRAVIVGGGLIGIEMAEMFRSRAIPVTMLVREENYWNNVLPEEEASMISDHIREHHIDLRLNSNLKSISDDGTGRVKGVVVAETGDTIDCGFVGLTPGVSPNIDLVRNGPLETDRGIVVDRYLQTNIDGVWAVGDCVQLADPPPGRRSIEAVWYTGRMMGETVAYSICGQKKAYNPGLWFNSAKFLDIEYQVYGSVPNIQGDGHRSFFWLDKTNRRSLRVVFEPLSKKVLGFNLMGIRFRHEVCEKWILEETLLDNVMADLQLAHFDPELFSQPYQAIINDYNIEFGANIKLNRYQGTNPIYKFLKSIK